MRIVVVGALAALVFVVYAGAIVETLWTRHVEASDDVLMPSSCTRPIDHDNSDFQVGRASVNWPLPTVHCHYSASPYGLFDAPEHNEDHFPLAGISVVGAILFLVSIPIALGWAVLRSRLHDEPWYAGRS